MASSLDIIGNHKIEFDNPKNIIKRIEASLGIKVKDGSYSTLNDKPKNPEFDKALFYSSFEHFEHNFNNWKMVKIISNYDPCYEIKIYKKTILINTNLLVKYWKPVLLDLPKEDSRVNQYQHTIETWKQVESVSKKIIKKLNGSQILYLSDDYENITDECFEGEFEIQDIIRILTKDYNTTQYNWITENKSTNRLRYNWLNMKLDSNGNWMLDPNETLKNAI